MSSDRYVRACPYCGGTEMIETLLSNTAVYPKGSPFHTVPLLQTICRRCGSVVRSYVADPEKLLKRKDRRKNDD